MANRYILMVSENDKIFTVNALYEAVKKANIEIKSVLISDPQMADYIDDAFGVLIADTYDNSFKMNQIKSKCVEKNKRVILYGGFDEIGAMKRVIPESLIFEELVRPVELESIIHSIVRLQIKAANQEIKKKILVVDDNGVMLRTIMGWLEGRYEVSLANSAANATYAIQKSKPDLILLDYEMPVCSGAQFMELLANAEATKDIPIIFLTSRSDAQTVNEVVQLKPKGYILKTTPQDQVLKKLEDFFDSVE